LQRLRLYGLLAQSAQSGRRTNKVNLRQSPKTELIVLMSDIAEALENGYIDPRLVRRYGRSSATFASYLIKAIAAGEEDEGGRIRRSIEDWQDVGLSPHHQLRARAHLKELGILEEKYFLGQGVQLLYKLDVGRVLELAGMVSKYKEPKT
jgi:hypothetical protein